MEGKVRTKKDVYIQHSTLRTARNSTSASPTIQHSKLNTQHSNPHPYDGMRRAILRWGTLDSIIICVSNKLTTIT